MRALFADSHETSAPGGAPPEDPAPTPPAASPIEAPPDPRLIAEFAEFLRENKKWWLIPLVGSLLMLAALMVLSASPAAPFIYTLF